MRTAMAKEALDQAETLPNDRWKEAMIQVSQANALIAIAEELKAIRELLEKYPPVRYPEMRLYSPDK